tara:strand:+ start:3635 stop:4108 length:474 start_codon:yes stop_codon:yes gene_type:complete
MIEIERKFLVNSTAYVEFSSSHQTIVQGFLNTHPARTVRVRIKENKGYLTIKGKSNLSGTSRFEWEQEVPLEEAENLLRLCEPGIIEKVRYLVIFGGHVFEVDVFQGDNHGLVIAEVELQQETEPIMKPDWLGLEVTGDVKYYNSYLSKHPFKTWKR